MIRTQWWHHSDVAGTNIESGTRACHGWHVGKKLRAAGKLPSGGEVLANGTPVVPPVGRRTILRLLSSLGR